MKQTYTDNDLVKYLYNEVSFSRFKEIEASLEEDFFLQEAFDGLLEAKLSLPNILFMPSERSVQNILDFSESAALEAQF